MKDLGRYPEMKTVQDFSKIFGLDLASYPEFGTVVQNKCLVKDKKSFKCIDMIECELFGEKTNSAI